MLHLLVDLESGFFLESKHQLILIKLKSVGKRNRLTLITHG